MKVNRILLTGDDGYNAVGIRLLIAELKDKYQISLAATRDQMSGVGGHISMHGAHWGETRVDGVDVLWVDGYPTDAMECAVGYYKKPFDLVISGINQGMNIGGALFSSGTYAAANRAVNLKLAPKSLALSWNCPPAFWTSKHTGDEDLGLYREYPGKTAGKVIQLSISNDFWGADILNINFPTEKSNNIRFTQGLPDLTKFFNYPTEMDRKSKTFNYSRKPLQTVTRDHLEWDTGAMLSGFISITPNRSHNLDSEVYNIMKDEVISL
jgi:5'-nucleotidase